MFEVSEGLSVKLSEICAVRDDGVLNCKILIDGEWLRTKYPYTTLVDILKQGEKPKEEDSIALLKKIDNTLSTFNTFAG
jgi:hypothetical protein